MTDRDRLAEIMARAVYSEAPIPSAGASPLQWEDLDRATRVEMMRDQAAAIAAAERAGFLIVAPDDGR